MRQKELYDNIKVCEHDSDYSVLYDFVGMRHAMCNSCWHEEETRAHEQGHGKCISEMAVACGECGVPSLRRGRYGADGMYQMLSGFIERNGNMP